MKAHSRRRLAMAAAVMTAGIFSWTFALARKDRSGKKELRKAIPIQAEISVQNGETLIAMTPQAQKVAGIVVAPLRATSAHRQITVPAQVLPIEDLARLRKSYIAATVQLAKARSKADASRQECARLKSLGPKQPSASPKSVQAAEDARRSNEADVQVAQQELALVGAMARQNWGSVVEQWLENDDPGLEQVLGHKVLLVEVTVPMGESLAHPSQVPLQMPGGRFSEASFVSFFSRADPRRQGVGFLYRISAQPGLSPGANLVARPAVDEMTSGVIIPSSAVVWAESKSWVYQQTAPGRFVRRQAQLSQPEGEGYFVRQGLSAGDLILVQGVDVVRAEEFHFGIQSEHEGPLP